jgi:hypothetical protein
MLKGRPSILRRRPSQTITINARGGRAAWAKLLLLIACGQRAGVTSATVRVRTSA